MSAAAEKNPGLRVESAITRCLGLADTWIAWDGHACVSDDGARIYTPHKSVRRMTDHLVDHLAQIEAMLAGEATIPDAWGASSVTLESDWARFTEADLREARQRLERLARTFRPSPGGRRPRGVGQASRRSVDPARDR